MVSPVVTENYSYNFSNGEKTTTAFNPNSNITIQQVVDVNGNLIKAVDGKSYSTQYSYNLKDELTTVTSPIGTEASPNSALTSYVYDGNGNLTTITNAKGKVTSLAYNNQNQIISEKNAIGQETAYNYEADGRLKSVTKPDQQVITYNESETDTGTTTNVAVNNVNQFVTSTEGLITSVKNAATNETTTTTLSENNMLENIQFKVNNSLKSQISYNYTNEKLADVVFHNTKLQYTFNANDQITALSLNNQATAEFDYNEKGIESSRTLANGKITKSNTLLNGTTQLTKEEYTLPSKKVSYAYKYDKNEQITEISGPMYNVLYSYDRANQLVTEQYGNGQSIHYTYDHVGNRTSKTKKTNNVITEVINYQFNDANQLIQAGLKNYSVDVNGNLTNDGRYQYEWNGFDQLIAVKDLSGKEVASYKYDENGRRVYSKIASKETYYRYDGSSNHVLFEENAAGQMTKSYTYDQNGHPLTMTNGDDIYYYVTNYRGDVLTLTDENGSVVAEYTYDAWGNILTQVGSMASTNPYRYAGYRYDEETKLYYLMARYYNPDTGVFLSLDPVRGDTMNPITMNGYNYANNNPVMMVDPDGELPILIPFILGALEGVLAILARQAAKQAIKKLTPLITSYVKKYGKTLRFTGPKRSSTNKDNHTLFTLYSNKKQLLRVDMKIKYTKWNGYTAWIHYHVSPNMSKHYDLFELKLGKNLRRFPW